MLISTPVDFTKGFISDSDTSYNQCFLITRDTYILQPCEFFVDFFTGRVLGLHTEVTAVHKCQEGHIYHHRLSAMYSYRKYWKLLFTSILFSCYLQGQLFCESKSQQVCLLYAFTDKIR